MGEYIYPGQGLRPRDRQLTVGHFEVVVHPYDVPPRLPVVPSELWKRALDALARAYPHLTREEIVQRLTFHQSLEA